MFFVTIITLILLIFSLKYYYVTFIYGICKSKRRLDGKTVVITGGNSGIGFETAKDLAFRGAKIKIASEQYEDCVRAKTDLIFLTGNKNIEAKFLDLSSFKSIRNFANDLLKNEEKIDILINNAGTMGLGTELSEDGLIKSLQINYFGPFLLTNLVIELLKRSKKGRIVNVSSWASTLYCSRIKKIEDINIDNAKVVNSYQMYCLSKFYIVLMTWEMSRRLKEYRITVNCLHPGTVNSPLHQNNGYFNKTVGKYFALIFGPLMKTTKQGAQTSIYCAVAEDIENVTGQYFSDCKIVKPHIEKDSDLTEKFWDLSIRAIKLEPNEIKM